MPSPAAFYLSDTSGQNWKITVNTSGNLVATSVATVGTTPGVVPAGTYTPQDAINQCKTFSGNIPTSTIQYIACDTVQSIIWTLFPWNWTTNQLTAITLVDGTQDYSHVQTDFYRMKNLRIVDLIAVPNDFRELNQKSHLGVEIYHKGGLESIRLFSWEPEISKIRLERAASVPSGASLQLQGEYQFAPVQITGSNFTTALNLPNHYFPVYIAGVLWQLYKLNNDPRAGTTQVVRGERVYTGALGEFHDLLMWMKEAEDLSDGEDHTGFPESPLGFPKDSYFPRIFG